ncbi:MAG TPA: hypothetical protein VLV78_18845 [Thermoanaerobaculia bacterium]|nr:hypothetical protein [Thermoanaerobaculia bacterium]
MYGTLAKHGYEARMIDEPEDPQRPDNLWKPLPGDAGAHGVFDDRTTPHSIELGLNKKRRWIFAGVAMLEVGVAAVTFRRRSGRFSRIVDDTGHTALLKRDAF